MDRKTALWLLGVVFVFFAGMRLYYEWELILNGLFIALMIVTMLAWFAVFAFYRRETPQEVDIETIDWRSTKEWFRAAYHSTGGTSQRGGIIQQLEEIEAALSQLESCDMSEVPAIARFVHENFCGGMSAFLYLIDGEDDREDCLRILRRKRSSLLLSLCDLVDLLVLWREQNGNKTRRGMGG